MELLSLLQEKKILLFDGSMGAQLIARGLKSGELPDSWNLENPQVIQELFSEYYASGSDLVQTATFQSNGVALSGYNLQDKLEEINEASGKLLRDVCPNEKCVIGDIRPSGKYLPPVGKITLNELAKGFQRQIKVLDPIVDAWHIETISDIEEMKVAIKSVKNNSKKPIIASMTYRKTSKGFFTIMGNPIAQCIEVLINSGVSVVGSNCTLGSNEFIDLVKVMRETTDYPLSIKPNAGQPVLENGKSVYKQTPEEFAQDMRQVLDYNVQIIGGCCGTGPEHIKLLRQMIDEFKR